MVGRRILITGGTRSGKSRFAETLVDGITDVTYVATGGSRADDAEWAERVRLHQDRRPATWRTLETVDLPGALALPVVLIDSLTTWLSRSMFTDDGGALTPPVGELLDALRASTGTVVIVTDEVGSGVIAPTAAGRAFADAIGGLNAEVAALCDEVWLCVAGIPVRLQG